MPSLLNIPLEVRSQILELVLSDSRAPPQNPATASRNRIVLHDVQYDSWIYGPSHNKYEQGGYTTTSIPLLLTNRQLFVETQSVLKRLPTKHSYGLDIMFVNEQELWPTWLSVPALSTRVDNVVATVRIFGSSEGHDESGFRGGDGSPPQIVWCFYSLMERFLIHGPVGERISGTQDKNVTIKVLTLNVVTPLDIDMMPADDEQSRREFFRRRRSYGHHADSDQQCGIVRPEWLADFLVSNIHSLLRMGYHTAPMGIILYDRIGTIRVCVDGDLKEEYDLAKILANLRFQHASQTFGNVWPREKRLATFWNWKKRALQTRREAGLPVIDPKDRELSSEYGELEQI